jgi:hypothetical protein
VIGELFAFALFANPRRPIRQDARSGVG